jgi:hypothetical protein
MDAYFLRCANSANTLHKTGAVSGPTLLSYSPKCWRGSTLN